MPTKVRFAGVNHTQLPQIVSDGIALKGLPQTAGYPDGYGDLADAVNEIVDINGRRGVSLTSYPENADAGEWINTASADALSKGYDYVLLPTDGVPLVVSSTIRLRRGVALVGGATFDNQSGTILKRADNFGGPVIATDKWFEPAEPVDSHYYAIDGICIDGNKANNSVSVEAVAFWGVFVGSYIDNVFILDNFGPALSLEKNYDVYVGLLWVNGCVVGSRAGVEIDQTLSASGPIGIVEFNSLYVENLAVTLAGGLPKTTPTNRGVAIKVGNVGRLNIANYHFESADVGIQVTHGTNECVRIGQWSGAWLGDAARINSFIQLDVAAQTLDVGCGKVANKEAGYKWLGLAAGVISGNQYKEVASTLNRWGGVKSSISNPSVSIGAGFWGNLVQEVVGGSSNVTYRMQTSTTDATRNHYLKGAGSNLSIGSRHTQAADVDFILIESTGNTGDKIRILQPAVMPSRASAGGVSTKSLYEFTNGAQVGLCYQRVGGTADGADYIATVKQTGATSAPTENALYIGQIFVTRGSAPRNAYIAVNVGTGATDWRLITS
jgi:hypothetical protein